MIMSTIEKLLTAILQVFTTKTVSPVFGSSTTTGTVPPNSKASFINVGGAAATITSNGTNYSLTPNEVITLDPGVARRNGAVTFDATGTTLKYVYYL